MSASDKRPLVLVISGPSGVGKDTVVNLLKESIPAAHFAITATTRPPRPGEREGVDYHFLSEAEYDRLLAEDGFLERASVYSSRYGVPKDEVTNAVEKGRDVIVRVDVQGAATIKELIPDAVLVFIAPPSAEELERRLRDRSTDDGPDLLLRIETAVAEIAQRDSFDYVIVNANGRLEEAVSGVVDIFASEKRRREAAR